MGKSGKQYKNVKISRQEVRDRKRIWTKEDPNPKKAA